jgi:anti-sigma regulatory factor (Ser/Thr protein kinase)
MTLQRRMAITDASAIGSARRMATQVAIEAGADETHAGRVAIVASELATNLVRHGGGGSLLIQVLDQAGQAVVELVALDSGPGMGDTSLCVSDGYSTRGTSGNGLGAVRRLSVFFDIYSQLGKGTVVVARVAVAPRTSLAPAASFEFGAVNVALHGEPVCGDAWALICSEDNLALMVVDGLGHGLLAHEAALAARAAFHATPWPPVASLQRANEYLSSTRGGAVACALLDRSRGVLSYAGVGNISGMLTGERNQGLVSHNGTVGAQMKRVQSFDYAWKPNSLLAMHSDGVSARWKLDDYPGLATRHPALIAAVLFRDFARERDDATLVVLKQAEA